MTDTRDSVGRVRTRALLLVAAVFFAGGVGGIAFDRVVLRPFEPAADGRPGGRPFGGPPTFVLLQEGVPPFLESLGLTAAQRVQMTAIMAQVRPEIDSLTRLTMPRIRVLTDSVQTQMLAALTDEQRALLRDLGRARGRGPG